MNFTNEEKFQLVIWRSHGLSFRRIKELFHEMFPGRPIPTANIIDRIMNNLRTHGCFTQKNQTETTGPSKRPRQLNSKRELREIMVCAAVEENPTRSTRDIGREFGVCYQTVINILQRHGYQSFRLSRLNGTFPCDEYRRMKFCEWVVEKANRDENFISNVLFTSETSFSLYGSRNWPFCRWYKSRENRHQISESPQKLHVWAGILGDNILGPFFIEGNVDAQTYLELLQNNVIPALHNLGISFDSIWFQQDGRSAHNSALVKEFLTSSFPGRIIAGFPGSHGGCGMDVSWPVRSPDLAPCEFFLWKYVKSKIYGFQEEKANNFNMMQAKIADVLWGISPEILQNIRLNFYNRLGYCLAQSGGRFEYLL